MYNMMTIVKPAVWYIWKLLRINPKSSHHKEIKELKYLELSDNEKHFKVVRQT